MKFDKYFGEKENTPTTVLVGKFDARDEMHRAVRNLKMIMIKPMQSNLIRKPKEEASIAQAQYDRSLAEINAVERQYLERLEQAKKAGGVDNEDYLWARLDISSPLNPFERMRTEAKDAYRKTNKFS